MMARSVASLCALLLVWLCALGAGPVQHPDSPTEVARGAMELALRDVAEAPLLAPQAVAARINPARHAGRDVPAPQLAALPARPLQALPAAGRASRTALALQDDAHRARPRWRSYDAVAPPAPSRIAR